MYVWFFRNWGTIISTPGVSGCQINRERWIYDGSSGCEKTPKSDSEEPSDIQAYDKWLRKCSRTTAKIRNAMEPHICAQHTSDTYNEDPKAVWDKLAEGYRRALGSVLYYFRRSLFDCTLEAHGTVAKYLDEIDRIIECLREADQVIKPEERRFTF